MCTELSVTAIISCNVLTDARLPEEFSIIEGMGFHLWYLGVSHPARVSKVNGNLKQGDAGTFEILFTGIDGEADSLKKGLRLELYGGVHIKFAEGEILDIIDIV